jgi:hypothetical protein
MRFLGGKTEKKKEKIRRCERKKRKCEKRNM